MPACACCAENAHADASATTPARRWPVWASAVAVLVLIVAGLVLAGPVGAVLAGLGVLALCAVTVLAWRAASPGERMMRLAVFVFVVGICLVRLIPR